MKYAYQILDVFSSQPFGGGNTLAVLSNAEGLSTQGMQAITREFNFPETTFVLPPTKPTYTKRVRIFTPKAELDFAGHPTVGTACALALSKPARDTQTNSIVLEEGVGPIRVDVTHGPSTLSAIFTLERGAELPTIAPARGQLAEVLSLPESCVREAFFASAGLPFSFAHLATPEDVDRASIDLAAWRKHLAGAWSPHIYFYAGEIKNGAELYARMSAPALGVMEDPATGSACAALVGALANSASSDVFTLSVVQGVAMGRRSEIEAVARKRDNKVVSVSIGGPAAFVASGEISVPDSFLE